LIFALIFKARLGLVGRFVLWSRLSGSLALMRLALTPGVNAPEKRFYSLMIEVRPAEADAEPPASIF
jgi:hypothetical protein